MSSKPGTLPAGMAKRMTKGSVGRQRWSRRSTTKGWPPNLYTRCVILYAAPKPRPGNSEPHLAKNPASACLRNGGRPLLLRGCLQVLHGGKQRDTKQSRNGTTLSLLFSWGSGFIFSTHLPRERRCSMAPLVAVFKKLRTSILLGVWGTNSPNQATKISIAWQPNLGRGLLAKLALVEY